MGEEKKQLLTSFGLFFAGATPVKPDRNGKMKRGEGYQCSFSISSMFRKKGECKKQKKAKKKKNVDSKTMSQQCSSSPRLLLPPFLSFPAWFLCSPIRAWRLRRKGVGGGCRQRDLSASLPRPALGLTGAAEEWGQPQGLTRRSLDPGYPTAPHACE